MTDCLNAAANARHSFVVEFFLFFFRFRVFFQRWYGTCVRIFFFFFPSEMEHDNRQGSRELPKSRDVSHTFVDPSLLCQDLGVVIGHSDSWRLRVTFYCVIVFVL